MYFDGINLAEGSVVSNLTVASGISLPATPSLGELFYLTQGVIGLYVYDGTEWRNFTDGSAIAELSNVPFVISTANSSVPNAVVLSSIDNGFVKTTNGNISSVSTVALDGGDVSGILASTHLPALTGDVSSSSGSSSVSLVTTGVTPGTYNRVTVDAKGRVTSGLDATTISALGLTDAANIAGNITQNFSVQSLNVGSDILPIANGVQNIGSPSLRWATIYVNEAKLSTNTLYIGETPILGTSGDTINVKADPGQSLHVLTTTTGSTLVTSENQVQVSTSGMNADVIIQSTGAGSKVRIGATDSIQFVAPTSTFTGDLNSTGNTTFGGNLTVTGNLTINGAQTVVNSTTVTTKDNIILVNSGEVGSGVTAGKSGLQVDRGDLADFQIVFDEIDDMFKVGQVGQLETIASWTWVGANYAGISHVGSSGAAHALATGSVAGFMSATDKVKLDGLSNSTPYVHPISGVSAGTYTKVTVNTEGHVTSGASLASSDIPALDWAKLTTGVPTTVAGYGISDVYTKTQIDELAIDGGSF